jgi:hypothetical protein
MISLRFVGCLNWKGLKHVPPPLTAIATPPAPPRAVGSSPALPVSPKPARTPAPAPHAIRAQQQALFHATPNSHIPPSSAAPMIANPPALAIVATNLNPHSAHRSSLNSQPIPRKRLVRHLQQSLPAHLNLLSNVNANLPLLANLNLDLHLNLNYKNCFR